MNIVIYKIQSKRNSKCYIGSTNNIRRRIDEHFKKLNKNVHTSKKLQNHYNKHKLSKIDFFIQILESDIKQNDQFIREEFYIKKHNSVKNGFNILENCGKYNVDRNLNISKSITGNKNFLGKKHTQETKDKMRKWHIGKKLKPETIEKIKIAKSNINHTTRYKMEMAQKRRVNNPEYIPSRLGKKHTHESIESIKRSKRHLMIPIIQLDIVGNIVGKYVSINDASKSTGIQKGNISSVLKGIKKTAGGFYWKKL